MIYIPKEFDFAFIIVDDTDCAILPDIAEVYSLLAKNGIRSTKTVWSFPPKDEPKNYGGSLSDLDYSEWINNLSEKGFEIGLHNVGSGSFKRREIKQGLNRFHQVLGYNPKIHVNHSYNPDNIYSGDKRFGKFFQVLIRIIYPNYKGFDGENPRSAHFWGDLHKKYIKYSRNIELPSLDISKYFNQLPFIYKNKKKYSNYWYPVTFAPNPWMWNRLVNKKSIDKLEKNRGIAIVYTHFGYYHLESNEMDAKFVESINYIGKKNAWCVTISEFLDYQLSFTENENLELSNFKEFYLDFVSLLTRFKYRYIIKKDDYHFKRSVGIKW